MKQARVAALIVLASSVAVGRAAAGLLSAGGVAVLDANSAQRASFTNSERVTFQQKVYNGVASGGRIVFTFLVMSPAGAQVFSIVGNSVPGSVGNSATQLSGFPITKFYSGPGVYTLKAQAALDSQVIEQTVTFVVSSPNVLLVYPPNGAQNVADIPITFRWSSSGASSYKVTVGDNPSFYNSLFSQDTQGGETFLSYPINPSDQRQRLAAGQIYYWKVEGFDATGLKVGESAFPYSFTVQTAALSKDMAITDLSVTGGADAQGNLPFNVSVKNQGGTAQANIPLRFSVGGIPAPGTPVAMTVLGAGEGRDYSFKASLPEGQSQSLAVACLEFSDDNLNNNCKTLMVNRPASLGGPIDFGGNMTPEQIWQAIQDLLRQQGMDLSDYNLVGMEGQLSAEELKSLLDALRSGQADVSLSGTPVTTSPAPTPTTNTPTTSKKTTESATPEAVIDEEASAGVGTEWSGNTTPLFPKDRYMLIAEVGEWNKVWKKILHERPPKVDFTKHMVIGVLGGKEARIDGVEFTTVQMELSGLVARYRRVLHTHLFERPGMRAADRMRVPYRLRVIPKSTVPVKFELAEEEDLFGEGKPQKGEQNENPKNVDGAGARPMPRR